MKPLKPKQSIAMLKEWRDLLRDMITNPSKYGAKFDMSTWGHSNEVHPDIRKPVCATAACAAGWATVLPSFVQMGVTLRASPDTPMSASVCYGHFRGADAIAKACDISYEQARYIVTMFKHNHEVRSKVSEVSISDVVNRINDVIAELEGA